MGTGPIAWLPKCQLSHPERYGRLIGTPPGTEKQQSTIWLWSRLCGGHPVYGLSRWDVNPHSDSDRLRRTIHHCASYRSAAPFHFFCWLNAWGRVHQEPNRNSHIIIYRMLSSKSRFCLANNHDCIPRVYIMSAKYNENKMIIINDVTTKISHQPLLLTLGFDQLSQCRYDGFGHNWREH